MATAPADTDKAEDENADRSDRSTRVFVSQAAIMPTHTSTATANIYTPLITPSHNAGASATLVSNNASQNSENDIIKTPVVIPKKQVSKTVTPLRSVGARGQRSSVKPFFCCGSELSLVSLVDGLELKDSHPKERKSNQIECQSSSEEEDSTPQSSRKSSGSSGHSVLYSGESRHTVVRRKKKDKRNVKKKFWSLRFRGRWNPRWRVSQPQRSVSHRCDLSFHNGSGCQGTYHNTASPGTGRRSPRARPASSTGQFIDLSRVQDFNRLYPVDDIDTIRLRERAEEMAAGVEVDPMSLNQAHRPSLGISGSMLDMFRRQSRLGSVISDSAVPSPDSPTEDYSLLMSNVVWQWQGSRSSGTLTGAVSNSPRIHTQVDFIHCLVPQLIRILACPFYWGVMDRYEAERLLDNKPEGTFLLRDSAQEDFLFSVSFRRYNRSLHARVEQWNHRFSFDAHDPAVFSAPTVCDLMEHYKDPCCCMFFEPMLTRPLPRNFPFTLQHICRAVICDRLVYDQIQSLPLPTSLKQFLQVYHYKQKVRVRRFDGPEMAYADTNLVVN